MSETTILDDYQALLAGKQLPQGQKKTLLAAIELFSQQGFDGTSTAQIAEKAGVSQATIFKYYKTKEDLLNAVVEPVISELCPKIQEDFIREIKANSASSRADLVSFIVFNRFAYIKQNQQVIRIVFQQLLTKQDFSAVIQQAIHDRLQENPDLVRQSLDILLEKHPEYTVMDLVRIVAGPLAAYFMQRFVFIKFPDREFDEDRDLKQITKQILLVLD